MDNPSYVSPLGIFSVELKCRDICNESEEVMSSSCYVFVRACLNVQRFETSTSDMKYLPTTSPNMKCIWKSLKNYKKPYDINALEIRFSHTDLTGEPSFQDVKEGKTQKKLKLVIEIWVGGTEGDSAPPIRVSFAAYSVFKLLEAAGYPPGEDDRAKVDTSPRAWSKPIPREFVRLAQLSHAQEETGESEGFFSRIFSSKKKEQEEEGWEEVKSERKRLGQHRILGSERKMSEVPSLGDRRMSEGASVMGGSVTSTRVTPSALNTDGDKRKASLQVKDEKKRQEEARRESDDEKRRAILLAVRQLEEKSKEKGGWYSRKVTGTAVKGHGGVSHFEDKPSQSEKLSTKKSMGMSMTLFSRHVSLTKSSKDQFHADVRYGQYSNSICSSYGVSCAT